MIKLPRPFAFSSLNPRFEKSLVSFPVISFWSPTTELNHYAFYILAVFLIFIPLVLFYISKKRKKSPEERFDFELDNDDFIHVVLERAKELHVPFDLVCTRQCITRRHITSFSVPSAAEKAAMELANTESGTNKKRMRSSDVAASIRNSRGKKTEKKDESPYLTLLIPNASVAQDWNGAPVDVYLQLTHKEQCTLYHFASFVHRVFTEGGQTYMEIMRPSILSDSQAKEFVRIEPSPDTVALSSVWMFPKQSHMLPRQSRDLGKIFGTLRPAEGNSDFRIINISACGTRLRFVREDLETLPFTVEKGIEMCMLLVVNTPQEQSKRLLLWLKAECKGLAPCGDKDCVDVRFSFTHWQQILERKEDIVWVAATDSDRIPPLMHWIMNIDVPSVQNDDA